MAQAIDLLHQLFQEEQRTLAEQFTQPLADKISGYLRCLFGPDARAQVSLDNGQFTGLCFLRPSTLPFDNLSGGARGKVAAAVRLAMAEVLACNGGPQVIVLTCNPSDYAALGAKSINLQPSLKGISPLSTSPAPSGHDFRAAIPGSPDDTSVSTQPTTTVNRRTTRDLPRSLGRRRRVRRQSFPPAPTGLGRIYLQRSQKEPDRRWHRHPRPRSGRQRHASLIEDKTILPVPSKMMDGRHSTPSAPP